MCTLANYYFLHENFIKELWFHFTYLFCLVSKGEFSEAWESNCALTLKTIKKVKKEGKGKYSSIQQILAKEVPLLQF